MGPFLVRVLVNAVAVWVAALIVPGVVLGGEGVERLLTLLIVAAVFGVVNAVLKPAVQVVTLPLYVLTLGLFAIVVNALLFWLTGWLAEQFALPFSVEGFWAAVFGAIVVGIVSVGARMVARG